MAIDYTKFSAYGGSSDVGAAINKRWWLSPKKEIDQSVMAIVNLIRDSATDKNRRTQYDVSTRLYGNVPLMGFNGMSVSKMASVQSGVRDRITYNVAQAVVDTITSKIAKNKPKPLFLTSGGDHKIQRKAKKLDKFVEGVFYENEAYDLGQTIFRDSTVVGDGLVHVFDYHDRVTYERTLASELYVDWAEGFYGKPKQLHRCKGVDKEVLIDLFPEHKSAIINARSPSQDIVGAYQNIADLVVVIESWKLPSGPEAGDGVRTINIPGANLLTEEWDKPYFPFAKLSWDKRMYGFWGQGLVEQIQSIQYGINNILWIIQRSMHLAGSFKVFLERGSKIVKEHLNNDIGALVEYTGLPPQYVVPQVVPVEYYQHLGNLKTSAFEMAGISQLSATSQKPAGLNSGKALREFNDIETERFMTVGMAYEKFFLDLGKLSIECGKDIYKRKKNYSVKYPGRKFIQSIDWKDIDLPNDAYVMKAFPVSSLPNDPAGRLQTVQEYADAGYFSPRTARRLLDFPDLEQIEDLQNSQEEYLHQLFEKIVDEGVYTPPEPYDDLRLARELALEYYSQGKTNNLEDKKLSYLRTFIKQLDLLEKKAMPPQVEPTPNPVGNGADIAQGAIPEMTATPEQLPLPEGVM